MVLRWGPRWGSPWSAFSCALRNAFLWENLTRRSTLSQIQSARTMAATLTLYMYANIRNRPFYSCVLTDLAFEWK